MDPIARVIMGDLGVFVAWTLLRAWRSGVIYSRGYSFDVNDRPVVFALGFVVHVGIVVMCAAFAAGYSPDEVRRFALWSLTAGR
jgi:hypothetical protein